MDLRQIKYFKAIADARSFVRGAQNLRVAQPALSRSIAGLESEVGQTLFLRHSNGVTLTEAGLRFYTHPVGVLKQMQMLADEMASGTDIPHGVVELGVPPSMQSALTAPVVSDFLKKFGGASVNVVQDTSSNLRAGLLAGRLDLAIMSTVMSSTGLRHEPLYTESVCLIESTAHDPIFDHAITINDLSGLSVMICGYPNTVRLLLEKAFSSSEEKINFRCEANTSSLLFDLIKEGAGVGIAPSCAMSHRDARDFRITPVQGLSLSWTIASSPERVESAAAGRLKRMIVDFVSQSIDSGAWPTARLDLRG